MPEAQAEQRNTRRFDLRLPVQVKFSNGGVHEIPAQTRDVSARGAFFYMDQSLKEGSPIEFTLILPPEITLTESIRVRCKGKVVRIEPTRQDSKKVGVAAAIEEYDFVPQPS
jgi:hypothetical protein